MYKLRKNFDITFRPRAGENASASEVARTELQKHELEEPLGLESKQPLLWWKEHESLYEYLSLLSKTFCVLQPLLYLVKDFSVLLETWLL